MPAGRTKQDTHPTRQNLLRLCQIRSIVVVGLLAVTSWFHFFGDFTFPSLPVYLVLSVQGLINMAILLRLRSDTPVSEKAFFGNLLMDVLFLTALLYFTGGSTNPIVSYYLLPLIISAAILKPAHTWFIAFLSIGFYTLLLFYYQPLALFTPSHHGGMTNAHLVGMWINFGFSALLISWFVVRMASALRERSRLVAQSREEGLRNEQIIGVASIAAGTAHELRTPLATMAVTVDEIAFEYPQLREETAILTQQIARCEEVLNRLVSTSSEDSRTVVTEVGTLVGKLLDEWQLSRPEVVLRTDIPAHESALEIRYDKSLQHALTSLLNNAADASPEYVSLAVWSEPGWLTIVIDDRGPGIPADIAASLGKKSVSRKRGGLGLGVLLGQASIERLGGAVRLTEKAGPGTRLEVRLPLVEDAEKEREEHERSTTVTGG